MLSVFKNIRLSPVRIWHGYKMQLLLVSTTKRELYYYHCEGCRFSFATPDLDIRDCIALEIHPQYCRGKECHVEKNC
jgi:hypothetical protein